MSIKMQLWLDSVNEEHIIEANRYGIVSGITTNPTLAAKSKYAISQLIENLLSLSNGSITVQVVANNASEMVRQGLDYHAISSRIIIKIPLIKEGLEAINLLSTKGISCMATALFSPQQAFLAALAGADFVAPYISRIENAGSDPWKILDNMINLLKNLPKQTHILAASLKTTEQVLQCARLGIFGVTLKNELFQDLIQNDPYTVECVNQFAQDWQKRIL